MLSARPKNISQATLLLAVPFALLAHALPAASQGVIPISCFENEFSSLPSECETFSFELVLDQVSQTNGILGATVSGEMLTGTFTVYNATPDVEVLPDLGVYVNALECVTLNFEDRTLSVDLSPVEVEVPPSSSDPGILVTNDFEEPNPAGSLFSDAVTFAIAGSGLITLDDPDGGWIWGGGGITFGYGNGCFAPFQSPCPPTLLTDDTLPGAPGDLTQLVGAALLSFQFVSLQDEPASAQATMLSINSLPPIPCPEPGFGLALAFGFGGLLMRTRARGL